MPDFKVRSYQKELLDNNNIPFPDIRENMKELNTINTLLGGHNISIKGFKKLLQSKKEISICEIGCGGGDNLHAIYRYCKTHSIKVAITGIDINPECIQFTQSVKKEYAPTLICSDYKKAFFEKKPDIIFSSLFCHHFNNDDLLEMINWMKENSNIGFFINDLHRHPIAYYFIKLLTRIFSRSYLVKNDAPLSVLRGFVKKEWQSILTKTNIQYYSINWCWAFRYLIVSKNGE